jgi:hypothetical protein
MVKNSWLILGGNTKEPLSSGGDYPKISKRICSKGPTGAYLEGIASDMYNMEKWVGKEDGQSLSSAYRDMDDGTPTVVPL